MITLNVNNSKKDLSRRAAVLLAAFLILSAGFSVLFLIHEAGHECTGADCHICSMMETVADNIRSMTAALGLPILAVILLPAVIPFSADREIISFDRSLVGQKIRMND